MGCFSTCFNTCKTSRRRRRQSHKTHPSLLDHLENYQSIDDFQVLQAIREDEEGEEGEIEEQDKGEEEADNPIDISPERKVSNDEMKEKSNSSGKKKVTFDLNVKFYENMTKEEEDEDEDEIEEERFDDAIGKIQVKPKSGCECECECSSDSNSSSLFSYPINHRYQNIRDSDDDFDDTLSSDDSDVDDYTDYDDDDDDDEGRDQDEVEIGNKDEKLVITEEQTSDSLFSLSTDSRKVKLGLVGCEKEVNSPMPTEKAHYDQTKYFDSVLNPVENLTQWKEIKSRSRFASKDQPKENLISVQDFMFPVKKESVVDQKETGFCTKFMSDDQPKENVNSVQNFSFPVEKESFQNQKEISVDTSLSAWLTVGQGKSERSNSRNSSISVGNSQSESRKVSPNKFEDRPILGALTLEEIRQISANTTPRKSPSRSRSPDEMPIIGSVGSYWSHTGQGTGGSSTKSTKSRYRESAEVIWDSTPFEARLEKALEKEAHAEEVSTV